MNAVIETPKKSVLTDMANRFGMEEVAFQAAIIDVCFAPKKQEDIPTVYELSAFLLVAKEYRLNPMIKEIYGFRTKSGAIQPVVSVDGWLNLVNSHPAMNGMEFTDHLSDGNLTAITCRLWRKDREKPIEVTEYMEECRRDGEVWKKWPRRMLRHKALIQTARYAFGFAGIVDPDEAERIDEATMRDITPTPPEPTTTAKVEPDTRVVTDTATATGKPGESVVWTEASGATEKTKDAPATTETTTTSPAKETPLDPPEPTLKRPQKPQPGPSTVQAAAASVAPTASEASPTTTASPEPSGSATTAPDGDGLDIPAFLDRRGVFDEAAWLADVTAKTAACMTDDDLVAMQQSLCIPNRRKISDEGWAKHVEIIRQRIKELALIPPPFDANVWIDRDLAAALVGAEGIEELNDVKNKILLPSKKDLTTEQWRKAATAYNERLKVLTSQQQGLS